MPKRSANQIEQFPHRLGYHLGAHSCLNPGAREFSAGIADGERIVSGIEGDVLDPRE